MRLSRSLRRQRDAARSGDRGDGRGGWLRAWLQPLALLVIGSLLIPWGLGRANRVVDDRAKERAKKESIVQDLDRVTTSTVVLGDLYAAHLVPAGATAAGRDTTNRSYEGALREWLVQGSSLVARVHAAFPRTSLPGSTKRLTDSVTDYLRVGAGVEVAVDRAKALREWRMLAREIGVAPRGRWEALLDRRDPSFYVVFRDVGYDVILRYRDALETRILASHAEGYLQGYLRL